MIYFLITLVFIAQLVILANILSSIINVNKKVNLMTSKVDKERNKLKYKLRRLSEDTKMVSEKLSKTSIKIKRTRLIKLISKITLTTLPLFLGSGHKKTMLGLKIGLEAVEELIKA